VDVNQSQVQAQTGETLRLAELLAAVSLATDLADDAPFGSALGDAVAVVALARVAGFSDEQVSDAYYLALLYHVGCTAAVLGQARIAGGDDVSARHWFSEADYADSPQMLRLAATRVSQGFVARAQAVAGMVTAPRGFVADSIGGICEVGAKLGARLGAGPHVTEALDQAYARWDGKVFVALPSGEAISPLARLVHVVHVARAFDRAGGHEAADEVVRGRRGSELDPELCDLWLGHGEEVLRQGGQDSIWEAALEAEPEPRQFVAQSHVDAVTEALADFVDLKASLAIAHSSHVAGLVSAASAGLGLSGKEAATMRRAAQVHDLGNVSVPHRILVKKGPIDRTERDRIRLHTYHTHRVLSVSQALREIGEVAGMHHERPDGTGYHRGLPAAAISPPARLLAVAEAYQSMREERPWRGALPPERAADELRREAREGRMDRRSVDAVLETAGQGGAGRRAARNWPAGLTDREVDVLRTLSRGHSNKEIAWDLHVSEATVHTHVINVYGKIGVKTRAGATLFALENDLIQL
jgi:HD-GYP domain-containing protein (c-di-GMP phosphodiesterase class II)